MFLQAKKNGKTKEDNSKKKIQEVNERINQEIVIHNMPSKTVLANFAYSQDSHGSSVFGGNQHKKIGLFIIIGGLVFVILIIYLVYSFIIKPAAKAPVVTKAPASIPTSTSQIETAVMPAPVAPVTPLNIIEADLGGASSTAVATSAASSTLVFTGEENIIASATALVLDSDSDGLNDSEEVLLGADLHSSDSDGDGFSDLAEVLSGYDPLSTGKLAVNPNLAKYSVATYEILYPKTWALKPLSTDEAVIFTAPDESFIQLSVQKNIAQQSIETWYKNEFVVSEIPSTQLIANSLGTGVLSPDGLTAYFTDSQKNNIYIFSYTPLDEKNLSYPNIFKLMINSLTLKN